MHPGGSRAHRLDRRQRVGSAVWSPDGSQIAFRFIEDHPSLGDGINRGLVVASVEGL
jgi:hypothetical protein